MTLADDLMEGGCKGQFYRHSYRSEEKGDIYSVLAICYFSVDDGIIARVQIYDREGNCLNNNKFIFLGDRLTDRRAPQDAINRILAQEQD